MPELPVVSAKRFLKLLIAYGCSEVSVKGSHHKIRNNSTGKMSVVPVHSNTDLKKGLLPKILKDLSIDIDEFLDFIKKN